MEHSVCSKIFSKCLARLKKNNWKFQITIEEEVISNRTWGLNATNIKIDLNNIKIIKIYMLPRNLYDIIKKCNASR